MYILDNCVIAKHVKRPVHFEPLRNTLMRIFTNIWKFPEAWKYFCFVFADVPPTFSVEILQDRVSQPLGHGGVFKGPRPDITKIE